MMRGIAAYRLRKGTVSPESLPDKLQEILESNARDIDYQGLSERIVAEVEREGYIITAPDNYQEGERVISMMNYNGKSLSGKTGKVVCTREELVGVDFDHDVGGNKCHGKARAGHGQYLPPIAIRRVVQDKDQYDAFVHKLEDLIMESNEFLVVDWFSKGSYVWLITEQKGVPECTYGIVKSNGRNPSIKFPGKEEQTGFQNNGMYMLRKRYRDIHAGDTIRGMVNGQHHEGIVTFIEDKSVKADMTVRGHIMPRNYTIGQIERVSMEQTRENHLREEIRQFIQKCKFEAEKTLL